MIQNVLRETGGIGLFGVISICLFFLVFTGALVWAMLQKGTLLKAMESLPLSDGEVTTALKGETSHE